MVNKPLIRPHFWGGYVRGGVGWLDIKQLSNPPRVGALENLVPRKMSWKKSWDRGCFPGGKHDKIYPKDGWWGSIGIGSIIYFNLCIYIYNITIYMCVLVFNESVKTLSSDSTVSFGLGCLQIHSNTQIQYGNAIHFAFLIRTHLGVRIMRHLLLHIYTKKQLIHT